MSRSAIKGAEQRGKGGDESVGAFTQRLKTDGVTRQTRLTERPTLEPSLVRLAGLRGYSLVLPLSLPLARQLKLVFTAAADVLVSMTMPSLSICLEAHF